MSGFLIIDKPRGATSFSMVALVRRLSGVRRVGHAGTLDPLATGVLPVAIGPATRLIEYMEDAPKAYAAGVRFGVSTDTYDADGQVTATGDAAAVTADALAAACAAFVGDIEQTPPIYSALKLGGKPLYRYAREGKSVEVRPRTVRIDAIEVRSLQRSPAGTGDEARDEAHAGAPATKDAVLEVRCRSGTYVRSLAHDLGQRLGCGAHLVSLRRTASGGFGIEEAHAPDAITAAAASGQLDELLLAADRAVERRPAAILERTSARDVLAGRDLVLDVQTSSPRCRVYAASGDFLAVLLNLGGGRWHPEKVLAER
jgi:tRNA pseudouridine55 synthase